MNSISRDGERSDAQSRTALQLSYELHGVIADVKQGNGFDAVCLETIERVAAALSPKSSMGTEPSDEQREKLIDLIAEHLSGTYHCTRVWSAWGVGTMSEDDFEDVGESDTPTELADAVLALAAPASEAVAWAHPVFVKNAAAQPGDGMLVKHHRFENFTVPLYLAAPAVQHKTLETMAAEAALEQDPELAAPAVQPEPAILMGPDGTGVATGTRIPLPAAQSADAVAWNEAVFTERRASWANASERDRSIAYLALDDLRSKLRFVKEQQ